MRFSLIIINKKKLSQLNWLEVAYQSSVVKPDPSLVMNLVCSRTRFGDSAGKANFLTSPFVFYIFTSNSILKWERFQICGRRTRQHRSFHVGTAVRFLRRYLRAAGTINLNARDFQLYNNSQNLKIVSAL